MPEEALKTEDPIIAKPVVEDAGKPNPIVKSSPDSKDRQQAASDELWNSYKDYMNVLHNAEEDPSMKESFARQMEIANIVKPSKEQIEEALKERTTAGELVKKFSGEYKPEPIIPKEDFFNFASIALLLASIAGQTTSNPFLTSLTMFTSAMKGYSEGRTDKANHDYNIFKDNFSRGLKQREEARLKVKDILEDSNLPLEAKIKQSNYYLGLQGARFKTIKDVLTQYNNQEKMNLQAELQLARLNLLMTQKQQEIRDQFRNWPESAKIDAFKRYYSSWELPPFGWGDKASRNQFFPEFSAWMKPKGLDIGGAIESKAKKKAEGASIAQQVKSLGAVRPFIINLQSQNARIQELSKEATRLGYRIGNVGLREAIKKLKGSGLEARLEMLSTEISTEAAKIASGSQASVAQLPEGARKKWQDVHDLNLPISELIPLFNETVNLAEMREDAMKKGIGLTEGELGQVPGEKRKYKDATQEIVKEYIKKYGKSAVKRLMEDGYR